MYRYGYGVPQNYETAAYWYKKACDNGEQDGCNNYEDIKNTTEDKEVEVPPIVSPTPKPLPIYNLSSSLPKGTTTRARDIAVIIGNSNYSSANINNVDYAINDARMIKKYLIETFGFDPTNILYKENAGKIDFDSFFGIKDNPKGDLYNYVAPGVSNVFVFYSGHGAPGLNNEGYFVPVDALDANSIDIRGYPISVFYQNLAQLPVKESITVVLDACFSGAGLFKNTSPVVRKINPTGINSEKILVFSSSKGIQMSSWHNEQKHGMFSFHFLKAIHNKNADTNKDNILTAQEIQNYVSDIANGVPYFARRYHRVPQNPQLMGVDQNRIILRYQ